MPRSICARVQLLQHLRRLILVQAQLEARQRLANLARHPRQQVRPDGGQQGEAQLAGERVAMRARERDHLVARLEDAPGARHDLFARLRSARPGSAAAR